MKWRIVLLIVYVACGKLISQNPNPNYPVTDGYVYAIAESKGILYLGGNFSRIGQNYGSHAVLDLNNGSILINRCRFTGPIAKAISDNDGGFFVVGSFQYVNGKKQVGFAHILKDGSLDDWNLEVTSEDGFMDIVLKDSILYLSGYFYKKNSSVRISFCAVDWRTKTFTSFNAGFEGLAYSLTVADSLLIFCGDFYQLGGVLRKNIGAINLNTGTVSNWTPEVLGLIYSSIVHNNILYVGGGFSLVNGFERGGLAAFDLTTRTLLPWNPATYGNIKSMSLKDSIIYIAGSSIQLGDSIYRKVASININTGLQTSWKPSINGFYVENILVEDEKVFISGLFDTVGNYYRRNFACINAITGEIDPLVIDPIGNVLTLASDGKNLFIGGQVYSINPEYHYSLAAVNIETKKIENFSTPIDEYIVLNHYHQHTYVNSIQIVNDDLYCGGYFIIPNELDTITNLVRINLNSGKAIKLVNKIDGEIKKLIVRDSIIYLLGDFTMINDSSRNRLAAITLSGKVLQWNPNIKGLVNDIATYENSIFIGGSYLTCDDSTYVPFFEVDAGTGELKEWGPKFYLEFNQAEIKVFHVVHNKLFLGGSFTGVNDTLRKFGAAFDLTAKSLLPWNPNLNGPIYSIFATSSRIYLGGNFYSVGGQTHIHNGATDANTGLPVNWGPHAYDPIKTILVSVNTVFMASTLQVGNYTVPYFAAIEDSTLTMDVLYETNNSAITYALNQNYPNPFNPVTTISYSLESLTKVTIEIYDILGRKIQTLLEGYQNKGNHNVVFNGRSYSSGTYFYLLRTNHFTSVRKMVIIK